MGDDLQASMSLIRAKLERARRVEPCEELAPNWDMYLKRFVDREAELEAMSLEYRTLPGDEPEKKRTFKEFFRSLIP
jgi:hypothetical protein